MFLQAIDFSNDQRYIPVTTTLGRTTSDADLYTRYPVGKPTNPIVIEEEEDQIHYPLEISPSPTPRDFMSPSDLVIDFSAPESTNLGSAMPTPVAGVVARATTGVHTRMVQQQQQQQDQHVYFPKQSVIPRHSENHQPVEQDVHVQSTTGINNARSPSGSDQVSGSQTDCVTGGRVLPTGSDVTQKSVSSAGTPDQTVHSTQPDVGPATPNIDLENR